MFLPFPNVSMLLMDAQIFQLMFSKFEYDGKLNPTFGEGPFQLPVSSIRSYIKDPITPRFNASFAFFSSLILISLYSFGLIFVVACCRFVHVGSAGVTRTERPGLDLSKQPPAVRLNKELGFILTFKLKVSYYLCVYTLLSHKFMWFRYATFISLVSVGYYNSIFFFLGPRFRSKIRIHEKLSVLVFYWW